MPVYKLDNQVFSFPNPSFAERTGLLAVGSDLHPNRLLTAYAHGIFPWYGSEGWYFWYTPDPRFVLYPAELKVHKSMRSVFNQHKFRYTLDTQFRAVMQACADTPRKGAYGTWIDDAFIESYTALHEAGLAHSVEVWQNDDLVGGLYGVSLGKIFFGESMFAKATNASKAGFITLVHALAKTGFNLIDCQMETEHLTSLGARGIPRSRFLDIMDRNRLYPTLVGKWRFGEEGGVVV